MIQVEYKVRMVGDLRNLKEMGATWPDANATCSTYKDNNHSTFILEFKRHHIPTFHYLIK